MKKYLKFVIVFLLILAVIGGTCYFFFKNQKEKNNTTEAIVDFLGCDSAIIFNENLNTMNTLINSDGTDSRLTLIISTKNNLDKILYDLSSYYIASDTKISNEKISKLLNNVKNEKAILNSMMQEYKIKSTSNYFNRHLGANDFYVQVCSYLTQYAKLVNSVNETLEVNKNSDIKFNMYEIYANVVIISFKNLQIDDMSTTNVEILDASNINIMNNNLVINNMFVQTDTKPFSIEVSSFDKYYSVSNKVEFATKLSENITTVNSVSQESNEKIATYYFKLIMGL